MKPTQSSEPFLSNIMFDGQPLRWHKSKWVCRERRNCLVYTVAYLTPLIGPQDLFTKNKPVQMCHHCKLADEDDDAAWNFADDDDTLIVLMMIMEF